MNGGLPAGQLRGKMHVVWSGNLESASVLESVIEGGSAGGNLSGALKKKGPQLGGVLLKQGFLLKQGSKVKSWKRRWFILNTDGELAYFADQKAITPLDRLKVAGDHVTRVKDGKKQNCIAIESGKRRLLFCADNEDEYEDWVTVLQALGSATADAE